MRLEFAKYFCRSVRTLLGVFQITLHISWISHHRVPLHTWAILSVIKSPNFCHSDQFQIPSFCSLNVHFHYYRAKMLTLFKNGVWVLECLLHTFLCLSVCLKYFIIKINKQKKILQCGQLRSSRKWARNKLFFICSVIEL